jgi:UDP-N-acetylmuramoylalanine--D-glutamate ligase
MKEKITILGAGESGLGAALLAQKQGYAVWVSDMGKISEDRKQQLTAAGISFEEGQHTEDIILSSHEIIKSPGISPKVDIIQKAVQKGIAVIDELEFALRFSKGKIIAITGTNGKTTTTLLTYHLLKKGGLDVGLAGNVGKSWAGQLVDQDHEWWVLETSSFQIDGFVTLKPTIAILTNITPDHLDRYNYQIENYIASKMSLFSTMDHKCHMVYFAEDPLISSGLANTQLAAEKHQVSLKEEQKNGAFAQEDKVTLQLSTGRYEIASKHWTLKGMHNALNASFASIAALLAGVEIQKIEEGLSDFSNAPHRMELVDILGGVTYINDSKGTNVDATMYALQSFEQPLIWIAGGVDKGNDYSVLLPLVQGQVKALICLGVDNEKLKSAFNGVIPLILETQDMAEAVGMAREIAQLNDVVLLSPACASFDLFKNYEDRGNQFNRAVNEFKMSIEE